MHHLARPRTVARIVALLAVSVSVGLGSSVALAKRPASDLAAGPTAISVNPADGSKIVASDKLFRVA